MSAHEDALSTEGSLGSQEQERYGTTKTDDSIRQQNAVPEKNAAIADDMGYPRPAAYSPSEMRAAF